MFFLLFLYMQILKSTRADKRLMAIFKDGKIVHFGAKNGSTYVDHHDPAKRAAYLARHGAGRENWADARSPGALARWILWGDYMSIDGNIAAYKRRFSL
jgi:hypothetical protein